MPVVGNIEPFDESQGDWDTYAERVKLYFSANTIPNARRVPALLSLIYKTYSLLRSLTAPADPATKSPNDIITTLKDHFCPAPLVIVERFRFHKHSQGDHEPIKDFVADLKALSSKCEFGDFLDDSLRDKFVCGLHDTTIQRKLLTVERLTFQRAVEIATTMELAMKDSSELHTQSSSSSVHQVKQQSAPSSKMMHDCYFCGGNHQRENCPVYGSTCSKCHGKNHWRKQCETVRKHVSQHSYSRGRARSKPRKPRRDSPKRGR